MARGAWLRGTAKQNGSGSSGETVQLTIDMELQLAAEAALANWAVLADDLGTLVHDSPKVQNALRVGHGRAGLALMDVHRGELLALASYPNLICGLFGIPGPIWQTQNCIRNVP